MAIVEVDIKEFFSNPRRLNEFNALCEANKSEVESGYAQNLSVNWDAYAALQAAGALIALGVFDGDAMVGYGCAVIAPSLHYSHITATNDVIFILPEYRKKGYGLRLIREMQNKAKQKGAHYMIWQAKTGTSLNEVFIKMGCKAEEIIYTKELKNGI